MKYRKKPVVIEAFKWTGDMNQVEDPEWIIEAIKKGTIWFVNYEADITCEMIIKTLEGSMKANQGDYIIKGINGEIYPCKPDIFEKTYEQADKEVIVTAKAVVDAINKSQGNIQVRESGLR